MRRIRVSLTAFAGCLLAVVFAVASAQAQSFPQIELAGSIDGFAFPVHITHAGDDRIFVVQVGGKIRVVKDSVVLPTPFLDISARQTEGLYSVAFPSDYLTQGYFFVNYVDQSKNVVIARYQVSGDPATSNVADPNSERIVLRVPSAWGDTAGHAGGELSFSPIDGYLYFGIGDGDVGGRDTANSEGDTFNQGQKHDSWRGKMLRLDVSGGDDFPADPNRNYRIPVSNPFATTPGYLPEIWALGMRNPWRSSFDRQTGDFYIGDVGQDSFEEIDFQAANSLGGENYGWKITEGIHCYSPKTGCSQTGLTLPVVEYPHGADLLGSVTGGRIYRGTAYPELQGIYFYGDYEFGAIWGLRRESGVWQTILLLQSALFVHGLTSFGEDFAGNVWVTSAGAGTIYKIGNVGSHINTAPAATSQSATTNQNTAVNLTLNASDIDGDALTYSIVGGPGHGTLSGSGANRIYTPAAGFYGSDGFTFKANDAQADSNVATVSLTVIGAPVIAQLSPAFGPVGTAVTITGVNFGAAQGTGTVTFNGVAATSITSWNAASIVALVPVGATTGNVVVTTGLVGNAAPFTVTGVSLINVALAANGGVTQASSSYSSAYGPAGAINGDRDGTSWAAGGGWNDATLSSWPDWLEVHFNTTKVIQEVDVFTVQDNYNSPIDPTPSTMFSLYGLTDFQVQFWNGAGWQDVPNGLVTGNNRVWRQFVFSPITTGKIRVLVNGALNSYSRITEVEAYGTEAAPNVLPTVFLNSPSNGDSFNAPATVLLSANAGDTDGSISQVAFYAGSSKIATSLSTTSPYTATWNNVAGGNYSITAVAMDNVGATATSTAASIVVSGVGLINVALTSNGGTARASSSYSSAYAAAGTINGDRKGLSWAAGGGWNDATPGTYPDWLEVDFAGASSIQEIDVFTVQDNYASPIEPIAATTFSLYGLTDFQVQYWDGVSWYDVPGGVLSGNNRVWRQFMFSPILTSKIRILVNGAMNSYSRITEIEAYGTAAAPNTLPTVTLNSPANNDTFAAPATVLLSANAGDPGGSISQVAFYVGNLLIATSASLTNPYTATWNNVAAGSYTITAVATDNQQGSTSSAPVNIIVTGTSPVNVALATNGGTAVASSSYSSAYGTAGAINGDRKGLSWAAGGGWNDATAGNYPDWLEVDFSGVKTIQEIDVFTVQDNYNSPIEPTLSTTFSLYGLTDFQVQYWNGVSWQDVPGGVVTGNNRVWRQFIFSPIATSKIRVLVNGALNSYSRISEVEAR